MKKLPERKLKRPVFARKEIDFYGQSYAERIKELDLSKGFEPTTLSEFAAGYNQAISNIRAYGLKRVIANAQSGIPK